MAVQKIIEVNQFSPFNKFLNARIGYQRYLVLKLNITFFCVPEGLSWKVFYTGFCLLKTGLGQVSPN